jgi:hypothetical protein
MSTVSTANENFRNVSTSTDRPQVMNVGVLNAGRVNTNQSVLGTFNEKLYVGYTPTSWSTAAAGVSGVQALQLSPGQANGTGAGSLVLPVGSVIKACQVQTTGVTSGGSPTLSLGTNVWGASSLSSVLLDGASVANSAIAPGVVNILGSSTSGMYKSVAGECVTLYPEVAPLTAGSAIVYLSVLVPASN